MQSMYSRNPHGNFPAIVKLLNTAKQKLDRPILRLATQGIQYRIYPAAPESRNRGFLYVKRQDGEYLGKIAPNGDFYGDPRFTEALRQFNNDPVSCATLYGKETGACCFCGQALTDSRSVAVGYGPICADKWGLPWGEIKTEPVVELADLAGMAADLSDDETADIQLKTTQLKQDLEEEEYAFGAIYHAAQELSQWCDTPPVTKEQMTGMIMNDLFVKLSLEKLSLSIPALRDHESAIMQLLTTYPILKE